MAKKLLSSALALSLLIIITSCSSSNNTVSNAFLQKRKHTKGYHLNLGSSQYKANKKTTSIETIVMEETSQVLDKESKHLVLTKTKNVKSSSQKEFIKSAKSDFFTKSAAAITNRAPLQVQKETSPISNEKLPPKEQEAAEESAATNWSTAAFIAISFSLIGLFVWSIPLGIAAIIFGIIAVTSILKAEKEGKEKNGYTLGILGALIGAIEATVTILFLAGLI